MSGVELATDFETYFSKDYSLKKMTTMSYIMDERFRATGVGTAFVDSDDDPEWYSADEVADHLEEFDWPEIDLVCHNTAFDAYILVNVYGHRPRYYYDTASMVRALHPQGRASLAEAMVRWFPDDETMRKGEELVQALGLEILPPDIDEIIGEYCRQDVRLTKELFKLLKPMFQQSELDLMNLLIRLFVEPQIMLDIPRITAFRDSERKRAEELIKASGIPKAVLSSNKQFAELLEEMELPVPKKNSPTAAKRGEVKMIPALGVSDIPFNQLKADFPEHQDLWDARTAAKSRINETRATRFLEAALPDGRIPMPLKYYGAHTGRFSGIEKMNVQNMTRGSELRKSLISPENMYVYVADLSQIEARMLAWISNQLDLLQAFRENRDIYSEFATMVYGFEVIKADHPVERFVGKNSVLGLGYGMGAPRFKDDLLSGAKGPVVNISIEESQRIVNLYRNKYSMVPAFWRRCQGFLYAMQDHKCWGDTYGPLTIQEEKLYLPNGLALHYPDMENGQNITYAGRNYRSKIYGGMLTENICQALARIVITDAMLRVDNYFRKLGGGVAIQVHDEIVAIGPKDNADLHMQNLLNMICVNPSWCPDLPLAAEGGYDEAYTK